MCLSVLTHLFIVNDLGLGRENSLIKSKLMSKGNAIENCLETNKLIFLKTKLFAVTFSFQNLRSARFHF